MKIIPWKLPIFAPWSRALELKKLSFDNKFIVLVEEEESGKIWQLTFETVQAVKIITEECTDDIISILPEDNGLFEVLESPWIKELGYAHFLKKSHHFIICCYDDIIQVVAWNTDVKLIDQGF
jgi:hypothetical protein